MIIYKITNLINGKIYVGKRECSKDLFLSSNYYGGGKIIKEAIKRYNIKNFKKEILEVCRGPKILKKREKFWIKKLNCISPNGYNLTRGGDGGGLLGKTPWNKNLDKSDIRIQKMVEKVNTVERAEKISKSLRGKKLSNKNKKNLSKSLIEFYKTHDSPFKGKKFSDESKNKISINTKVAMKKDGIINKMLIGKYGSMIEDRIEQHKIIAKKCDSINKYFEKTKNIPLRRSEKIKLFYNKEK